METNRSVEPQLPVNELILGALYPNSSFSHNFKRFFFLDPSVMLIIFFVKCVLGKIPPLPILGKVT